MNHPPNCTMNKNKTMSNHSHHMGHSNTNSHLGHQMSVFIDIIIIS